MSAVAAGDFANPLLEAVMRLVRPRELGPVVQSAFRPPGRSLAPELASDGGLFIFMFWYFHKGLEPHLQRAHAGHTQAGSSNGG